MLAAVAAPGHPFACRVREQGRLRSMVEDAGLPDRRTQEQVAKNDATFRDANARIAATADRLELEDERVPFLCECADTECFALVRMRLDEYRHVRSSPRWFVNAPGHQAAARGLARVVEQHRGYLVIEKVAHAGEVAEQLAKGEEALESER